MFIRQATTNLKVVKERKNERKRDQRKFLSQINLL